MPPFPLKEDIMSDMNPKPTPIKLGDKEYGLLFTINAIDDIQDHFDIAILDITELLNDPKKQIKAIRYLLTVLINEGIDWQNDHGGDEPHVDERYVGRLITAQNINYVVGSILAAFSSGAPESDETPNG
jgi:hypothetical protein